MIHLRVYAALLARLEEEEAKRQRQLQLEREALSIPKEVQDKIISEYGYGLYRYVISQVSAIEIERLKDRFGVKA